MENEKIKTEVKDTIKIPNKFVWGFVLILILAVGAFYIFQNDGQTKIVTNEESVNLISPDSVAAIVNGEEIKVGELNAAYDSLPPEYKSVLDKSDLLEQLVQTKVIYQEAVKQGIVVDENSAKLEFEKMKLQSGLTDEQVEANLANQGINEKDLLEQYTKQMIIQKFVEEKFLNEIKFGDEEIKKFYDSHFDQFKEGEKVEVKHILIGDGGLNMEQRKEKAESLLKEVNPSNFCDFVKKYSTDSGSVANCGQYTFGKEDPLVEGFKLLAFAQNEGEIGIADTEFGSHIILTVKKIPPRTIKLSEAGKDIENVLRAEKGKAEFQKFYEELSRDSVIEIKFENL